MYTSLSIFTDYALKYVYYCNLCVFLTIARGNFLYVCKVLCNFSCSLINAESTTEALAPPQRDGKRKRQEVLRRYSEFEALRNFLSAVYPHIVIPPLPEKAVSAVIKSH